MNEIKELLLSTRIDGIEKLIDWMNENGFFTSPCSSQYHLCKEGGLAEHSLNVYYALKNLANNINFAGIIERRSIILAALLHDIGKTGQFGKKNYVENMVSDRKGGYKQSDKKPYVTNSDLLYVDHEIRGLQIISQFIELTEEESFAILYHNGLYTSLGRSLQGKERPLQMLLHFADLWCSRVIEKEEQEESCE